MALGNAQAQLVGELIELGRLTSEQESDLAGREENFTGEGLEKVLLAEFGVAPFAIIVATARINGLGACNVSRVRTTARTFARLDEEFCRAQNIFPVGEAGALLLVAVGTPYDEGLTAKIHEISGMTPVRLLASPADLASKYKRDDQAPADFARVVDQLGAEFGVDGDFTEEDLTNEESGPIVELASQIIEDAYFSGTSDIHIEPWEKEVIVRNRIDGVCVEKLRLPGKVGPALVARLKIMCNLDIAERRLPQDGRIVFKQYTKKSIDIDLRVSTAPLNHGEGVVMRILDKQKSTLPMTALGFSEDNLRRYRECITQPYGMILHCGPTGSGKSMTLYSALNEINAPDVVIRTAEDPIEYTLAGINQMQMHRQIGLTFAAALRAFLRQDPDIILVGEIRDRETANIAVEAALTGHLLISTLHTNDAPSTVARLTDMGVEPFMISSSLLCVCAQRLMRRVCKQCRQIYEPEGRVKDLLAKALDGWTGPIYRAGPGGCPKCGGTGYKGRVGIHELMVTNNELIEAINKEAESSVLKHIARKQGMKTLHQDSMLKVKEGLSTFEEAISTVPPDMT